MGIYHLSVSIIKRSDGRSSVAAAAYISGSKLYNTYDGLTHDYTRKEYINYSAILLPTNAPKSYMDRETLWNAVENSEKSSKSQLARSIIIALPKELSFAQQKDLLEHYVQENFVSKGMCADIAIHNPPKVNSSGIPIDENGNITHDPNKMYFNNPHAHIMLTLRPIAENGKWEPKTQIVYLCKKGAQENGFTSQEFKDKASEGWEKQYQYTNGKKKQWLTASEGESMGLKRLSRSPKTTPFGKLNPIIEEWNSLDSLKTWRLNWEESVNNAYKDYGINERIDSRSFLAQGRKNEIPSVHVGPAATYIHLPGNVRSDRFSLNEYIGKYNYWLADATKKYHEMVEQINTYIHNTAFNIFTIKNKVVLLKKKKSNLESRIDTIDNTISTYNSMITLYKDEYAYVQEANKESKRKILDIKNKNSSRIHVFRNKNNNQQQIEQEEKRILKRNEHLVLLGRKCSIASDADIYKIEDKIVALQQTKKQLQKQIDLLDAKITAYNDKKDNISSHNDKALIESIEKEIDKIRAAEKKAQRIDVSNTKMRIR